MPHFVRLVRLTEQGMRQHNRLGEMVAEVKAIMAKHDTRLVSAYATLGHYDFVAVIEAPDAATAARVSALIGQAGNFRAETLAAVPIEDFMKSAGD